MNYADAFYWAQVSSFLCNTLIFVLITALAFFVGWAVVCSDHRGCFRAAEPLPWPKFRLMVPVLAGLLLAITATGFVPDRDTIIATAVAEHGIDKAERMMTLLEGLGK